MLRLLSTRSAICVAFVTLFVITLGSIQAADLDPKAINITLPKDIKWVATAGGSEQAILAGDPSKPGIYVVLTKWLPNKNSRPHSHPNDRFIMVMGGTMHIGTGPAFDKDNTVALPKGGFVRDVAQKVHFDGSKDDELWIQIAGIGPASTPSR